MLADLSQYVHACSKFHGCDNWCFVLPWLQDLTDAIVVGPQYSEHQKFVLLTMKFTN